MFSNKEIKEKVFKVFNDYSYEIESPRVGSGYYLFNLGEESVVHFKIKGCKRWLFGLWITTNKDENKTRISLFGEHEDYIDKFKPTAVPISSECEFDKDASNEDIESDIENLVWDAIYDKIEIIKSSNIAGKLKFHFHGHSGAIKWMISQWWFYRIENPFRKWLKYNANKYVCIMICFILNLLKSRKLKAKYEKTDYFFPAYEIHINYKDGTNDDDIFDVYKHIKGYVGFDKSILIEHIPFGEKRGICFVEKE